MVQEFRLLFPHFDWLIFELKAKANVIDIPPYLLLIDPEKQMT